MSLETDPICLALEENGDVVIPMRYLAGLDAVVQGVVTRLRMIRGELRWDLSIGVPYFERDGVPKEVAILGQKYDAAKVRAAIRDAVLDPPNVFESLSLSVAFDSSTRTVSVEWAARTFFGDTETNRTAI